MKSTISRSGYTSIGFSKAGFGACSRWHQCGLGRLQCAWERIDSEVKDYCHCYKRNRPEKKSVLNTDSDVNRTLMIPLYKHEQKNQIVTKRYMQWNN